MKTQKRILSLLLACSLLFIIAFFILQQVQLQQKHLIINSIIQQQNASINTAIKIESARITQVINDNSSWDEMVRFVKKPNYQWADDNIASFISSYKVSSIFIYNVNKQIVYQEGIFGNKTISDKTSNSLMIPQDVFSILLEKRSIHYFLKIKEGILEISGNTIHPSFDTYRKTAPQGFLFLAKIWNNDYIKEFEELTNSKVEILSLSGKAPDIIVKKSAIVKNIQLTNWKNQPVVLVSFTRNYQLINLFESLNSFFLIFFILLACIILIIFYFTSRLWVYIPLKMIKIALEKEDYQKVNKLKQSKTEFRQIGFLIDRFINQKHKLEKEINERKLVNKKLMSRELQLATSLDAAGQGLWDWNINNNFIYFDKKLNELLGGMPKEYHLPFNEFIEIIHPKDWPKLKGFIKKLLNGETTTFDMEYRVKKLNGDWIWLYGKGRIIEFTPDDKPLRMTGTIQDITDRVKFVTELSKAKKQAEESDKLKSAFLANMSHEIRTPMNGILGFTELLKEPDLSPEERSNYLQIVENSGNHLLNIINDIVDISKIEADLMKIHKAEYSVNEILNESLLFFSENQKIKKNNIQLLLKKGLPDQQSIILTDKTRLNQILTNIIGNACKFTNKGYIEFGYQKQDEKTLLFYVKDTGFGIPKNKLQAIFERFIQADTPSERQQEGTGLGLAISKALVELLGGKIWVESEIQTGSTFYFTIPFDVPARFSGTSSFTIPIPSSLDWHDKTILIAEDIESNYYLLKIMLRSTQAKTLWALNGQESVDMVKQYPEISLVLMDIRMPVMNGYEATRLIKKMRPDLPVIAQTAYSLDGDKNKSFEAGCDEYVTKPVNTGQLLAKINFFFQKK
ncbi:MAG TPA: ATP-binding protein [Bacteroidales bacterium]|nr:ATP-binding protein [Bacteroidales bacterium]